MEHWMCDVTNLGCFFFSDLFVRGRQIRSRKKAKTHTAFEISLGGDAEPSQEGGGEQDSIFEGDPGTYDEDDDDKEMETSKGLSARKMPPRRLQRLEKAPVLTADDLTQKQRQAEERRMVS
jgi:hypothetical protein